MPKIISAQEAKKIFQSEDFPQKGYFVIEMKKRPYALVLELEEHMRKMKKKRHQQFNGKTTDLSTNLSQKIKEKLKELIS